MTYSYTKLKQDITSEIANVLGTDPKKLIIEPASEKFDADLAVPIFALAKEMAGSPQEIAASAAKQLKIDGVAKIEAQSGFINLWLDSRGTAAMLADDLASSKTYGAQAKDDPGTIVVDFASPNLAKPFSIGHLRPTNQGWAMIQLLRNQGYNVIGDNHIGDWGTPFGKWVVGFERFGSEEALNKDGVYELSRVYVKINEALKEEERHGESGLREQVRMWLQKLEAGDDEALEYHKRFMSISRTHIDSVLDRLKVKPDEHLGESTYVEEAKKILEDLLNQGIAEKQDDGSVIVRLDDCGIDIPALLQKSDGSILYMTTDIATIKYRLNRWHPIRIVYAVAAEQKFHFEQLFALAKKLKLNCDYTHAWFGLIEHIDEGKRKKMSSREGTVLLEKLLDEAERHAREQFPDANLSDKDIAKIAVGAVKFTDFSQRRNMNVLFDWQRMFSLSGFSGPYVQYAAVRINSILKKSSQRAEFSAKEGGYDWSAEKGILVRLLMYPEIVREAADTLEPHKLAQYVYELARAMNRYYEATQIIGSDAEPERLGLIREVRRVFEQGLDLLGIEIPDKM